MSSGILGGGACAVGLGLFFGYSLAQCGWPLGSRLRWSMYKMEIVVDIR